MTVTHYSGSLEAWLAALGLAVLFSVVPAIGLWIYMTDRKRNWIKVGEKSGVTYWVHRTKRKRRFEAPSPPIDTDWLKFRKDCL